MSESYTQAELEAYLDEALPIDRMAAVENALRSDSELLRRLSGINAQRDCGVHSIGEVWRRSRLTCPTREQLGSYLLQVLLEEHSEYIRFHVETIGCRYCQANLEDLRAASAGNELEPEVGTRRRRYFQSSAGHLKPVRQR
jgi:hypothetical protein